MSLINNAGYNPAYLRGSVPGKPDIFQRRTMLPELKAWQRLASYSLTYHR
jgi:hypothetical protein